MKNYKNIFLLLLVFLANVFVLKADVRVYSFKIQPSYLAPGGGLNVPKLNAKTPFKIAVSLSRSMFSNGAYESGACKVTLVYAGYNGTTELGTRDVTSADFNGTGFLTIGMDAELAAGIVNGGLYLRFTYFDTPQQKLLTQERNNESIPLKYTGPRAPISDLFTYPALNQFEVGVKLPNEEIELKWRKSELGGASTVNITIYEIETTYPGNPSSIIISKQQVPNTGSLKLDAAALQALKVKLSFDYHFSYYVVIETLEGMNGKSGLFCFVNEHPGLWPDDVPNSYPHAFWIFRPDSSGSGYGELKVKWLVDRINASNVSIDLYNEDGTFNRNLISSTPNTGNFMLPKTNNVPLGPFYQFKITSIENPSEYGFSEVFHHYLD
ncbi:hypothetical protein OQX61_06345 [Pedobacter sp. PLR]|uniref:hypothetical protein n=1 Tax=Pedobacter sp. PLR TaxID=2994465 RepID=UPI002247B50B|nr:hypothetical protein [Pedobacter sp. PLR]MCX2450891.1 hypothetical protein [Pedobacter sp. PLR]